MSWWIYLKIDNGYILLNANQGNILISKESTIKCHFDIEKDDIFTISSVSKSEYGIINEIDVFKDKHANISALGFKIDSFSNYIFFDALNYNGFTITNNLERTVILENYEFKNHSFLNA